MMVWYYNLDTAEDAFFKPKLGMETEYLCCATAALYKENRHFSEKMAIYDGLSSNNR